jgi:hypothetical protein
MPTWIKQRTYFLNLYQISEPLERQEVILDSATTVCSSDGKSLVYRRYRIGRSTLPFGTPAVFFSDQKKRLNA